MYKFKKKFRLNKSKYLKMIKKLKMKLKFIKYMRQHRGKVGYTFSEYKALLFLQKKSVRRKFNLKKYRRYRSNLERSRYRRGTLKFKRYRRRYKKRYYHYKNGEHY